MATAMQILNRLTLVATENLTGKRIVDVAGAHTVNKAIGVAEYDTSLGDAASVIVKGITHVISGAAIVAGSLLTSDSAGKAVSVDPSAVALGTIVEILGIAVDGCDGANTEIRVYVNPHAITGNLYTVPTALNNETVSVVAGETITANQIVAVDGTHTANKGIGVALNGGESTASITVQIKGTVNVVSGAAFAVGDYLTSDSAGKAIKYDPTNVNIGTVVAIIGIALAEATDANQSKSMLLCPGVAVGTKAVG